MNQIDNEFKQDIDSLIDHLFLDANTPEVEMTRLKQAAFIDGIIKDSKLTGVEAALLMTRVVSLATICTCVTILSERRNLPMEQMGVYFRKKLRERMQTYILTELHQASENERKQ